MAKKPPTAAELIKKLEERRNAFNKKARKFARKAEKADTALREIRKVTAADLTLGEALKKAGFEGTGTPIEFDDNRQSVAEAFKPSAGLPAATTTPKITRGSTGRRKLDVPPITCTKEA